MDPVIAEINDLCKTARYYRWADKLVRLGCDYRVLHIISMNGLEIVATALSSTMECSTCERPKDELHRTSARWQTCWGVGSNRHPTIPHHFKDDRRLGSASADTQRDRGNGSRLYEVNIWMCRY